MRYGTRASPGWPDQDEVAEPSVPADRAALRQRPGRRPPVPWWALVAGLVLTVELGWMASVGLPTRLAGEPEQQPSVRSAASVVVPDLAGPSSPVPPAKPPAAADPASSRPAGPTRPAQLRAWAESVAAKVGIPSVALAAYGSAERVLAAENPGCHLSWVALAGIGRVESDHGRYGGAVLLPDGRSDPPVVGIALDGVGVATIRDSDRGRLDGDPVHDRAVGPMQFIPTTWARWATDADGDGRSDPFALPDAALAAGRYLCRSGAGDLRTGSAWTAAVLSYNASTSYLQRVTDYSNSYAAASLAH